MKNICMAFFLLLRLLFSQLAGMSSQTIRITYYCSSFYVISIPYFLKWKNTTTLHSVFSLAIHVYFVIYWLYMYVISNAGATYPYIFINRFVRLDYGVLWFL